MLYRSIYYYLLTRFLNALFFSSLSFLSLPSRSALKSSCFSTCDSSLYCKDILPYTIFSRIYFLNNLSWIYFRHAFPSLPGFFVGPRRVPTLLWLSSSSSFPSPPVPKPISIKTSIFSWFEHHIQHIIHRWKEDSASVYLVMIETKTNTKTNMKTKTRTFHSKSSCI